MFRESSAGVFLGDAYHGVLARSGIASAPFPSQEITRKFYEDSKAAIGTVWTSAITFTRTAAFGGAR